MKKDGSTIVCRVVELTSSEIVYKKWSDMNGSNYVMERSAASAINYQNGKKVNLSEVTNLYTPSNQNDGTRQYNDRALLALDASAYNYSSNKVKTLRLIGLVGGPILFGTGAAISISKSSNFEDPLSLVLMGSGLLCTSGFLIAAHIVKRNEQERLHSSTIYQYDFKLPNSSSLSAGIDMVSDRMIDKRTLGLGLRYNF
ncbi:MAG: hypothetical protein IJ533_02760 [Prevotella sp.]|nr:hypothetical protein [Prevotella sp.]